MNTNKIKNQRDILLNIAMLVSGTYAIVPMYAMLFGFMTVGQACFFSVPSTIAFCITLMLND